MAPPRKILKQQQEILIDCLEQNLDMAKGTSASSPAVSVAMKEKWLRLTRKLNSVEGGDRKPVQGWKRYWFTWRHRCSKKAENVHKVKTESPKELSRFLPLDEIEVRVLQLNQKRKMRPMPVVEYIKQRDSDSEQDLEESQEQEQMADVSCVEQETFPVQIQIKDTKNRRVTEEYMSRSNSEKASTPPPQWALDLEERRIAAEERMAAALAAIADTARAQEHRRTQLDERVADALSAIAATLQEISHSRQRNHLDSQTDQEHSMKDVIFL